MELTTFNKSSVRGRPENHGEANRRIGRVQRAWRSGSRRSRIGPVPLSSGAEAVRLHNPGGCYEDPAALNKSRVAGRRCHGRGRKTHKFHNVRCRQVDREPSLPQRRSDRHAGRRSNKGYELTMLSLQGQSRLQRRTRPPRVPRLTQLFTNEKEFAHVLAVERQSSCLSERRRNGGSFARLRRGLEAVEDPWSVYRPAPRFEARLK
jgi:hypothetical protein